MTEKRVKAWNRPVKVRALNKGDEAWFYRNPKSIDVYCYRNGTGTISCRITRKQIEQWLEATKGKK